ncbi:MAG: hypothetical protein SXA11_13455 [Cyanobacteriota bacterium]|nr:hypothetical protein [Cyanobacteriota bacterium]
MYELVQILISIAVALLAMKKSSDERPLIIAAYSCVALLFLKQTNPVVGLLSYFMGMAILIYFAVRLFITIDNNINDSIAIVISKLGLIFSVFLLSLPGPSFLLLIVGISTDLSSLTAFSMAYIGLAGFFISFFYLAFVGDE